MAKKVLSNLNDSFADFKNSKMVEVFAKKAQLTMEHPLPNDAEWNALVNQFKANMPATYQFFFEERKLSRLELYTCILLILDFDESAIVGLTQSSSSAISIAKGRANSKLFHETGAKRLKYNLKRLL